jgi:hypothetical protein
VVDDKTVLARAGGRDEDDKRYYQDFVQGVFHGILLIGCKNDEANKNRLLLHGKYKKSGLNCQGNLGFCRTSGAQPGIKKYSALIFALKHVMSPQATENG